MRIFKRLKSKKADSGGGESLVSLDASQSGRPEETSGIVSKPNVLKRILASEKATQLRDQNGYVFLVDLSANKNLVREEIERRYGVKVESVNIIRKKGKSKQWRLRHGRQSNLKKAIVTLSQGHKIEI